MRLSVQDCDLGQEQRQPSGSPGRSSRSGEVSSSLCICVYWIHVCVPDCMLMTVTERSWCLQQNMFSLSTATCVRKGRECERMRSIKPESMNDSFLSNVLCVKLPAHLNKLASRTPHHQNNNFLFRMIEYGYGGHIHNHNRSVSWGHEGRESKSNLNMICGSVALLCVFIFKADVYE